VIKPVPRQIRFHCRALDLTSMGNGAEPGEGGLSRGETAKGGESGHSERKVDEGLSIQAKFWSKELDSERATA